MGRKKIAGKLKSFGKKFWSYKKYIFIALLIVVAIMAASTLYHNYLNKLAEQEKQLAEQKKPEPEMFFGFPVDSFSIESGLVRSGQNLSDLLIRKGVSMTTIDFLVKQYKWVFDARKIRTLNQYHYLMEKDSLSSLAYFIYEVSPKQYVVYQFAGKPNVYCVNKPVEVITRTATGEIRSSLSQCLEEQGLSYTLTSKLESIYQWTIDFFGLQKGDKFRIIYDEEVVDGKTVGIGDVYAAEFVHNNVVYFAFLFEEGNSKSYFDEKGQSLQTAFLKAPLNYSRISSRFSHSRLHPVLKIRRPHHGVDYAAPSGTPVVSIGNGTVIEKAYQAGGGGNYLKIKHNQTYTTVYMHLKGFASGIRKGVSVKQRQLIGYVGATGLASGPHLDFRVYKHGLPIDPLKMESPRIEPVSKGKMPEFTALKDSLMSELKTVSF
ncbi:MAG: peptidoglycan DD-metalloendopeptidase family protein [Prolixibacteraceae bacterium]|jgi:murein DD-endopeptidase MepM/ murein hydrolase activator NlpD|nr:peptidoglycan DD-metalloendopeptidase family protein [Prolixibacteraceae bacterium]